MKSETYTLKDIANCRIAGDEITNAIASNRKDEIDWQSISEKVGKRPPISIPPVQRGLVWKPEQVGKLWDSIINDIPIGSMLAYRIQIGGHDYIELLDGQQRCNAIRCGLNLAEGDRIRIWVAVNDVAKNKNKIPASNDLVFMVCSESHPWGFRRSYVHFSEEEKSKFNKLLKTSASNRQYQNDDTLEGYFTCATLNEAYPMCEYDKMIFVPLLYALMESPEDGWNAWESCESGQVPFAGESDIIQARVQEKPRYRCPEEVCSLLREANLHSPATDNESQQAVINCDVLKNTLKTIHGILRNKVSTTNYDSYSIPIFIISEKRNHDHEYICELFMRINRQGTPLSDEDAGYSELCIKMGIDFKMQIEKLSRGFMPPPRLANFAARLYIKLVQKKTNNYIVGKVRNQEYNELSNKDADGKNPFLDFCNTDLKVIISLIQQVYQKYNTQEADEKNDKRVPALIYLEDENDNWLTVVACILYIYRAELFYNNRVMIDKYVNLVSTLALLPDIFSSLQQKQTNFVQEFWAGIQSILSKDLNPKLCQTASDTDKYSYDKNLDDRSTFNRLLDIMAIGITYAALGEHAFLFPFQVQDFKDTTKLEKIFRDFAPVYQQWESSQQPYEYKCLMPFYKNEHLMYYAQRSYMALILKNTRLESKELWGDSQNKPFDIDHIIPEDWWRGNPIVNLLPNKQVYYFRDNRSKGALYAGVDMSRYKAIALSEPISHDYISSLFVYANENNYKKYKFNAQPYPLDDFEKETAIRWSHLLSTMFESLRIGDIISAINNLCDTYPDNANTPLWHGLELPTKVISAIRRYNFLKNKIDRSCAKLHWGAILHRGKKYHAYNELGLVEVSEIKDFYHSLTRAIFVGTVVTDSEVPLLAGVSLIIKDNGTCDVYLGKHRGFEVSYYLNPLLYEKWVLLKKQDQYASSSTDWVLDFKYSELRSFNDDFTNALPCWIKP